MTEAIAFVDQDDLSKELRAVVCSTLQQEMKNLTAMLKQEVRICLAEGNRVSHAGASSMSAHVNHHELPSNDLGHLPRSSPRKVVSHRVASHELPGVPEASKTDAATHLEHTASETPLRQVTNQSEGETGKHGAAMHPTDRHIGSHYHSSPSMGRRDSDIDLLTSSSDMSHFDESWEDQVITRHEASEKAHLKHAHSWTPHTTNTNRRAVIVEDDDLTASSIAYSMMHAHMNRDQVYRLLLDILPSMVILGNTVTLAMSLEVEPENNVWDILECIWVTCYFAECSCKVYLFGWGEYFLGAERYWNRFDFSCLVASLADLFFNIFLKSASTGQFPVELLKTLRLFRVARLVRALRYKFFEELKAMVMGVLASGRVLFWALVLLMVTIFVIGLTLKIILGEREPMFRTLSHSMFTVFRCFTDGCIAEDGSALNVQLFEKYGAAFFFGYILVFMIVTIGVFNLIIAIYIDNVTSSSLQRRMHEIGVSTVVCERRMLIVMAKFMLLGDPNLLSANDGVVTREVFNQWLQDPEMEDALEAADIEICRKSELFDVVDVHMRGQLGLRDLIGGLMRLRGPIIKSDIVAVRLKVRHLTSMIEDIWWKLSDGEDGEEAPPYSRGASGEQPAMLAEKANSSELEAKAKHRARNSAVTAKAMHRARSSPTL